MDNSFTRADQEARRSSARRYARLDILQGHEARERVRGEPATAARARAPHYSSETLVDTPAPATFEIDFDRIFRQLRRHTIAILLAGVAGGAIAMTYGIVAPAKFTSVAEILIDPTNLQMVSDDLYARNEQRDALVLNVESKMRILTSGNVLSQVVDTLDLTVDPEFNAKPSWFSLPQLSSDLAPPMAPDVLALRILSEGIKASRDERSFVVTLNVTTGEPDKSVRVANAVITAFQAELAKADSDGASRAADELTGRLAQLKEQVTQADQAVEAFRRDNNLQSSQGELISSLSMTQINTQVIEARERLIQARSRYERLSSSDGELALAAAAQESTTLSALRTQYSLVKQEAETLSQTLGPKHPKYLAIVPQLNVLQAQMSTETDRIVQEARTALAEAEGVAASLDDDANSAQSVVVSDNEAQVQLRELERNAASQVAIYEAFLSRAGQVTEREQIDTTNIRVISEPLPPKDRSWPPRTVQLGTLGMVAGMALAMLAALLMLTLGGRHPPLRK